MKKVIILAVLISVFLVGSLLIYNVVPCYARRMIIQDADNTICPVTGAKITVKRFNTTYKNKKYWFATYAAVREFKSNPEKYIRKLERLQATTPTRRRY